MEWTMVLMRPKPDQAAKGDHSRAIEGRDAHGFPTLHGRLVRADACGRPIGPLDHINPGCAPFDDAADKLMNKMGVGAVMAASRLKGLLWVGVVVFASNCEAGNRWR